MLRRNAKLRRKALRTVTLLAGFLTLLLAAVVYLRVNGAMRELHQAQAILSAADKAASDHARRTGDAEDKEEEDEEPSLGSLHESELSPATRYLLTYFRADAEWLPRADSTAIVSYLDHLRQDKRFPPEDELLDPRTHTADEIRTTICGRLRQSRFLEMTRAALQADDKALLADTDLPSVADMLPCVECELAGGDAVAAARAYLDACRVNDLSPQPAGWKFSTDRLLAKVADAFDGPIPDPLARELLTSMDKPVDLEPGKQALRYEAARQVEAGAGYRKGILDTIMTRNVIDLMIVPSERVLFTRLTEPTPTHKLLQTMDRVFALMDSPPYLVREKIEKIEKSVPPTATNTLKYVYLAESLWRDHHRHIAMAALAHAAFALKQYKSEHDRYPDTLEGLTPDPIPALPIDPMNGQSLKYAIDGEGFSITPSAPASSRNPEFQPGWRAKH